MKFLSNLKWNPLIKKEYTQLIKITIEEPTIVIYQIPKQQVLIMKND